MDHTYVADAGFAGRVARASILFVFTRPRSIFVLVVMVLVFGIGGAVFADGARLIGAVLGTTLGLLAVALTLFLTYRRIHRRSDPTTAAGAVFGSSFHDSTLSLTTPLATSEIAYAAYDRIQFRDGLAFLRVRASKTFAVLPQELFPDSEREAVRAKIEGTKPATVHD